MGDLTNRIIKVLKENQLEFSKFSHDAVYTCKEAANIRGLKSEKEGIKAMLFKTNKRGFLLVLGPGTERVDSKKISKLEGVKSLKLASPDEVKRITSVEIGCVAPFGYKSEIKTYVNDILFENEFLYFNPGSHTMTIKMRSIDLLKVLPHAVRFKG